jgi:hypothetical protein
VSHWSLPTRAWRSLRPASRTAVAFRRGHASPLALDAEAQRRLTAVGSAEEEATKADKTNASLTQSEAPLDEAVLTSDYVEYRSPRWGDSPREVLTNARSVFDSYIYERLLTSRPETRSAEHDWGQFVPEDTALCLLYWSGRPPLDPMIAGMLVTSSSRRTWIARGEGHPPKTGSHSSHDTYARPFSGRRRESR